MPSGAKCLRGGGDTPRYLLCELFLVGCVGVGCPWSPVDECGGVGGWGAWGEACAPGLVAVSADGTAVVEGRGAAVLVGDDVVGFNAVGLAAVLVVEWLAA